MQTMMVRIMAATTLLVVATAAWAAHIDVAAPGGVGVVEVVDDGQCSLREAMLFANNAKANDDCVPVTDGSSLGTINLPAGAIFTLTDGPYDADGPNGLPDVSLRFVIQGHGATITRSTAVGTPRFRLLHVGASGQLEINDVTFSHGYTPDGSGAVGLVGNDGGDGGGIYNVGTLSLIGSTVSASTTGAGATGTNTSMPGYVGSGGGIYNAGTLSLTDSTVDANATGAGISQFNNPSAGYGGGVVNVNGVLTISGSTISNNTTDSSGSGGGICNAGQLTISTSSLRGNTAGADGGGLVTFSGSVAISASTFSVNRASMGGALMLIRGDVSVSASTLSANSAGTGGGLASRGGELSMSNSTISGNMASSTLASLPPCNAIFALGNGKGASDVEFSYTTVSGHGSNEICLLYAQLTLDHTIIDGSGAVANCSVAAGSIVSKGYNLASDASCGLTTATDMTNTDPLLGALADNGGSTQTMLPWFDGPAVDAVPVADCALGVPTGVNVSTDQRGLPRPSGFACDIGAVEGQETPATLDALGGYDQHTLAGDPFEYPLVVQVLDTLGRPVKYLPILLSVPGIGASAVCTAADTDSTGIARVYCTANGVAGSYSVTLGAGNAGLSAAFTLTNDANDRIFGDGFEGSALPTMTLAANQNVADIAVTVPHGLLAGRIVPILVVHDANGHRVALVEARRSRDGNRIRSIDYDARGLPARLGPWQLPTSRHPQLRVERHAGTTWSRLETAAR